VLAARGFIDPNQPFSIPLHPSQIYSALNAFVLFLLTSIYFSHRLRDGSVVAVGWILYPITRFMLEFVRGDEMGQFNTSLTISQWISLGLLASGIIYWICLTWFYSQHPQRGIPLRPHRLVNS